MKSDTNMATLLLVLVAGGLFVSHPFEAFKSLEGLAGATAGLIAGAARGTADLVARLLS